MTNLITNHTYSNLVLRPPGVADFGFPLEEPQYKALGAAMTAHNGYSNDPGFGLYDTTGATEDWSFWSTGGFGFTFEIGPSEFHPPYATGVEAEYLGLPPAAGAGKGGNREAYYEMLKATADTAYHSLIEGAAPVGSTLRISKTFQTSTSPVWQDDFGTVIGDADPVPGHAELGAQGHGADVRVARQPVHAPGRRRPARPRPDRSAAGDDHARQPGGDPGGERQLPGAAVRVDPVHRAGARRRRGQRPLHGPHRVVEPEHRLGHLRGQLGRHRGHAVGGVRRHHRGRHAVRSPARPVHGARRQLRPGAEPARRLVQRRT